MSLGFGDLRWLLGERRRGAREARLASEAAKRQKDRGVMRLGSGVGVGVNDCAWRSAGEEGIWMKG